MPVTLTKTDIVNGALSLLGQPAITDLDSDDSEEGSTARTWYLLTRQQTLAKHPWRFAQKTVSLTADATPSNARYGSSFLVPADFISITETDLDVESIYYILEGDRIVVDSRRAVGVMSLTYTFQEENVGRYAPWYVEYLQAELASKMCYALLKDRFVLKTMVELAENQFHDAANRDAAQERNFSYIIDELSVVRLARG